MNSSHVKYLLIGGGLASSTAAGAIRRLDPQGELMVVGQEQIRPYHRPPLSKAYLRQRMDRQELFVQPAGWFSDQRIQLRTGLRASHLDATRGAVSLANGERISYDKLLIATGMSPAHLTIPGADLPNIYYMRTLEDADRLHHALEKAKREGRVHPAGRGRAAIVGAGVLGVDLAATLAQLGLAVDLIAAHAHPWDKFAGEITGRFIALYLEKRGVTVHASSRPARLEGDGRVQHIVLDEKTSLPCDLVIATVGGVANRELLRGTAIASEKAILVNDRCETNVPNIFAAGDCAAVFDPLFGKHRLLDHWDNATVTGEIAGTNMAGGTARYDAVNHFFSDVFDLTLLGWGEPRQADRRLIRGSTSPDSPDFVELGIAADGRVTHALAINHRGEDELLRELVKQRVRIEGNEEALKDPAVPLKTLLA
jgi:3-phenylpropionate/trans-cinnamate dioxygenase ferredoxin reductase subunit